MKKTLTILLIAGLFVMVMASLAYADDPADKPNIDYSRESTTYTEKPDNAGPDGILGTPDDISNHEPDGSFYNVNTTSWIIDEEGAGNPGWVKYGASAWTYQDTSDGTAAKDAKYEGAYRAFDYTGDPDAGTYATNSLYDDADNIGNPTIGGAVAGSASGADGINGPGADHKTIDDDANPATAIADDYAGVYNGVTYVIGDGKNDPITQDDAFADRRVTSADPHGGYGTTSNKCKTCHAVHRAEGAFALLRVDNPDEACSYCHIGDHRHSVVSAYWQDTANNIYASNGHTIGSGKVIPDSSVKQWTEDQTLNSKSLNEVNPVTINVRRYDKNRNRIMRYIVHGNRFIRVGPNYLRCASCHQVHNASKQIWKPWRSTDVSITSATVADATNSWTDGYKLLRNSPSGGIKRLSDQQNNNADFGTDYNADGDSTDNGEYGDVDNGYYDPEGDTQVITATVGTAAGYNTTDGLVDVSGAFSGTPGSLLDVDGVDNIPGNADDQKIDAYKDYDVYRLKAIDSTFTDTTNQGVTKGIVTTMANGAGSPNTTGYTKWRWSGDGKDYASFNNIMVVDETSMSFYCADCHNLNIAGVQQVETNWGTSKRNTAMLSDRSHPVPMNFRTGSETVRGSHCQSCHNNDMPYVGNGKTGGVKTFQLQDVTVKYGADNMCSNCHITPGMYRTYKQTYRTFDVDGDGTGDVPGGNSLSDWPHSGSPLGSKLLNSVNAEVYDSTGDGVTPDATTTDVDLKDSAGLVMDGAIATSASTNVVPGISQTTSIGDNESADYRTPYLPKTVLLGESAVDGLDKVCKICHGPQNGRDIGVQK